jgi:hypothetical protein
MGFDGCWLENNGWIGLSALGSGYYPHSGNTGEFTPAVGEIAVNGPAPEYSPAYKLFPYWSDVDTRNGPPECTLKYGTTIDGFFVVNWTTVGIFDREHRWPSTFQLIVGPTGFEFNYDTVGFDMGDASGVDTFGSPTTYLESTAWYPSLAGFYLPTEPVQGVGTEYYLRNCDTYARQYRNDDAAYDIRHDQMVDGGPIALVNGSFNSDVPGRYNFGLLFEQGVLKVRDATGWQAVCCGNVDPGLFKLQDGTQWWQSCCGPTTVGDWQTGVEVIADGPGPLWTDIIFANGDTYTDALELNDSGTGYYANAVLYESDSPTGSPLRYGLWLWAGPGATSYSRNIACGMLPVYAAANGAPLPAELAGIAGTPVGPPPETWPPGATGIEFDVTADPTMLEQRFRLTGYGIRGEDLPITQVTPIFGRVLATPDMRPSIVQPSQVAYLPHFGSPTTPYVEWDRTVLPYTGPNPGNTDYDGYGQDTTDGYEMYSPWFSGDPGYSHYDPTEGVDLVFLTADIAEAGEVYSSFPTWPQQTAFRPTFTTEVKYRSLPYRFTFSTSRPLKVRTEAGWVTAVCLHGV